jgi:hypothetical protein
VNIGWPSCCARPGSATCGGRPRPRSTSFWRPGHRRRTHRHRRPPVVRRGQRRPALGDRGGPGRTAGG